MSEDQPVNQLPYSVKSQATDKGFRVTVHVYGEDLEKVITDCANGVAKELNELEFRELVIAANQRKEAVTPERKGKK